MADEKVLMTREECEKFVECVLDVGAQMVRNGAEVRRAEDTMHRLAEAYGFTVMNSYAVTSQVELSVKAPDGIHYTQAMRIVRTWNDLGRVEELNADARRICAEKPPVEKLPDYISQFRETTVMRVKELIGYGIAAFAFSVFFGGSWLDGASSAVIALLVFLMNHYMRLRKQNALVFTMVACFLSAAVAEIFWRIGFGDHLDMIMSGDVMLFIPGLAVVNGIKEMFYRDLITGVLRIMEALLTAISIAVGYGLAILLFGML